MYDENERFKVTRHVVVCELLYIHIEGPFVCGRVLGTNEFIEISILALQDMFKAAIGSGIFVPSNDYFYARDGEIKEYKNAKNKKGDA